MIPPITEHVARAHWHLQIGYTLAERMQQSTYDPSDADDYDGEYSGRYTCWKCSGEGEYPSCCDDLCQDRCIHGDNFFCHVCDGEGVL